jgi:hypothetical protein
LENNNILEERIQKFYSVDVALSQLLCRQKIALEVALDCIDIDVLDGHPIALWEESAANQAQVAVYLYLFDGKGIRPLRVSKDA